MRRFGPGTKYSGGNLPGANVHATPLKHYRRNFVLTKGGISLRPNTSESQDLLPVHFASLTLLRDVADAENFLADHRC